MESEKAPKEQAKVKSEKFIHIPGSVVELPDRSCSSFSSESKKNGVCESKNRNPGLFKFRKLLHIGALLIFHFSLFTLFPSCTEKFEPFEQNDRFFFTVYGFLDASADTQWVRVSPVRGLLDMPPEIPEMTVTLENLGNGESAVMNDFLLRFRQDFNVLNVWSDLDIKPEQTYRLLAEQPNGKNSEVTVTIPEEFPTPRLFIEQVPDQPVKYFLFVDDVERLADVQSRWYYRISTPFWEEKKMAVISLKADAITETRGSYIVQMFPDREKDEIIKDEVVLYQPDSSIEFLHHQLYVASGGPEWDEDISSIDDLVYSLPDGFSNVENGLGYMVGIISKLIPFESCRNEFRELVGCPLEEPFW